MTFAEELRSRFATRDELAELQKAIDNTMQTAVEDTLVPDADRTDDGKLPTADVMITVDYDAELQRLVYHQSPFLTYLETHGCVRPASTAKVGYRVKKQMTTSTHIEETQDIPEHIPSYFEDEIAKMQTLVYPIEISDLACAGVDAIDLLEDEIRDGFLDMAQVKDKTILNGLPGTPTSNHFTGFLPSITTHTEDAGGQIEKDMIDVMAQDIIDQGGNPDAILTTAKVGRQLNDILYPEHRIVDKVDLTLGTRVTAYNAPNGKSIPIIVDPNIDTTDGDVLAFVDNNSLRVRELVKPSMVPLAKTKLSTSRVLFTYYTFYNRAEYRNGKITGITD